MQSRLTWWAGLLKQRFCYKWFDEGWQHLAGLLLQAGITQNQEISTWQSIQVTEGPSLGLAKPGKPPLPCPGDQGANPGGLVITLNPLQTFQTALYSVWSCLHPVQESDPRDVHFFRLLIPNIIVGVPIPFPLLWMVSRSFYFSAFVLIAPVSPFAGRPALCAFRSTPRFGAPFLAV